MQISIAHNAADDFVSFSGDPNTFVRQELGDAFVDELPEKRLGVQYVSDWLHLWLLTGLGQQSCQGDPVAYIGAVALVYAELAANPALFDDIGRAPVPPMPESLVTDALDEMTKFVSSPEFWVPVALTPMAVELTRLPNKKARRVAVKAFVEHPEWSRYGFHAFRYFPPYSAAK